MPPYIPPSMLPCTHVCYLHVSCLMSPLPRRPLVLPATPGLAAAVASPCALRHAADRAQRLPTRRDDNSGSVACEPSSVVRPEHALAMHPASLASSLLSIFDASSIEVPPKPHLGRRSTACVPAAMCVDVSCTTASAGEWSEWPRCILPSAALPMFCASRLLYGSEEPVTGLLASPGGAPSSSDIGRQRKIYTCSQVK